MRLLEVAGLKAGYKKLPVLHGISIHVEEGEILAVVGSNGAGKTTLLKAISGLIYPFQGKIAFKGESVVGLGPHEVVKRGIVQVPEGRQVFGYLTVRENLQAGSYARDARRHRSDRFREVFELFPTLLERKDQMARTLSGGEQQMLATARALMSQPELLMMDEPSWGLAPLLVRRFFETCFLINQRGCTILLVEQHVHQALSTAGRAYVLEQGNVVMEGASKDLLEDRRLRETYLGM